MSIEEQEIYWDLFCGGKRPKELNPGDLLAAIDHIHVPARVISMDEWNLIQLQMTDEEKAMIAYER